MLTNIHYYCNDTCILWFFVTPLYVSSTCRFRAGFTPSGAPVQKKCVGPYYMNTPPPDCLHPTRTVVIIDISSALALHWKWTQLTSRTGHQGTLDTMTVIRCQRATQNRFLYSLIIISIFLACYHVAKNEIKLCFCGAPFLWEPLLGRTCWTCLNPPLCRLKQNIISL